MSLANNFAAYTQWRAGISAQVERYRKWLADNDMHDAEIELRLTQLLG